MTIAAFLDPLALGCVAGGSFAVAWVQNGTTAALGGLAALRRTDDDLKGAALLFALNQRLGIPASLAELGLPEEASISPAPCSAAPMARMRASHYILATDYAALSRRGL